MPARRASTHDLRPRCPHLLSMLHQARGEDLDATLAAYSTARAPEIAALQELELLQSAIFTPGLGRGDAGAKAALLLRKWLMASYFGLRGIQTVVDYKLQVRGERGCSPRVRFGGAAMLARSLLQGANAFRRLQAGMYMAQG